MGNPSRSAKNTIQQLMARRREIVMGSDMGASCCVFRSKRHPMSPASTMIVICTIAMGHSRMAMAETIAIVARGRSGHRVVAMPQTACATTATATTSNPFNEPVVVAACKKDEHFQEESSCRYRIGSSSNVALFKTHDACFLAFLALSGTIDEDAAKHLVEPDRLQGIFGL